MKLNNDFLAHDMGKETILVPTARAAFSGVVHGNATLGAILELLKSETSEEAVVKALCERFDGPEEQIAQDVRKALDGLRGIGAIDG